MSVVSVSRQGSPRRQHIISRVLTRHVKKVDDTGIVPVFRQVTHCLRRVRVAMRPRFMPVLGILMTAVRAVAVMVVRTSRVRTIATIKARVRRVLVRVFRVRIADITTAVARHVTVATPGIQGVARRHQGVARRHQEAVHRHQAAHRPRRQSRQQFSVMWHRRRVVRFGVQMADRVMCLGVVLGVGIITGRVIRMRGPITKRLLRVVVVARRLRVVLTGHARATRERILITGRSSEMSERQRNFFNKCTCSLLIAGAFVLLLSVFWAFFRPPAETETLTIKGTPYSPQYKGVDRTPPVFDSEAFYRTIIDNNLFRPLGWTPPRPIEPYRLIGTILPRSANTPPKAIIQTTTGNQTHIVS